MTHALPDDDLSALRTGDKRLDRRCRAVMAAFMAQPGRSIPETMITDAATEGLYRALRNDRVTAEGLIAPHRAGTWKRAQRMAAGEGGAEASPRAVDPAGALVVLHGATTLTYRGKKPRAGLPHDGARSRMALQAAVLAPTEGRGPLLGVAHHDLYAAADPGWVLLDAGAGSAPSPVGAGRWLRAFEGVLADCPPGRALVHVLDGDELGEDDAWQAILSVTDDVVVDVRAAHPAGPARAAARGGEAPTGGPLAVVRRWVELGPGADRGPAAAQLAQDRPATLEVRVRAAPERGDGPDLRQLVVTEVGADPAAHPAHFLLQTTLPLRSTDDAVRVVDLYLQHRLLSGFFSALKVGCAAEDLQLESTQTLAKMLAILIPAAWRLSAQGAATAG